MQRNRATGLKQIKNIMESNTKTLGQVIDESHSLVHEISFNLENGNIDLAKEQLLKLDLLLHEV